jgi:4,5-DOPA dioxygenase extradiol
MKAKRAPAIFIGHGSPMNAIEDNSFTKAWKSLAAELPRPEAILVVSAHWYTEGTRISDADRPKMVYDMYGFPEELYAVKYPAPGSPGMARAAKSLISRSVETDDGWGLDHGAWSVLKRMYPEADIPAFQLSVDMDADAETHFRIGVEIGALREKGVMILGSGNVVHNLARVSWEMEGGFSWAVDFDGYVKEKIGERRYRDVVDYASAGPSSRLAFTTPDHFYPLLYALGASREDDALTVVNDACVMGSLSMTCYAFA